MVAPTKTFFFWCVLEDNIFFFGKYIDLFIEKDVLLNVYVMLSFVKLRIKNCCASFPLRFTPPPLRFLLTVPQKFPSGEPVKYPAIYQNIDSHGSETVPVTTAVVCVCVCPRQFLVATIDRY